MDPASLRTTVRYTTPPNESDLFRLFSAPFKRGTLRFVRVGVEQKIFRFGFTMRFSLVILVIFSVGSTSFSQEKTLPPTDPASPIHPRKYGFADHRVDTIRGWYLWKKWNPDTWEAEVSKDPPGETYKVRVLPWATTYRNLAHGARPDELLEGERVNLFFSADEHHARGWVVHLQDELGQMKGHGHVWKARKGNPLGLTLRDIRAQAMHGDKAVEEQERTFHIRPATLIWNRGGILASPVHQLQDPFYLRWFQQGDQRIVDQVFDEASLERIQKLQTERLQREVAKEGVAGHLGALERETVKFMVFATHWAQMGAFKAGQEVLFTRTGKGYRPHGPTAAGKVVSLKNQGSFGSGVTDVVVTMNTAADARFVGEWAKNVVVRMIPRPAVELGKVIEKHAMVPMRDGVKLSTYLYFPDGKGPWPVVYEQRYADLRGAESRKSFAKLAAAGFVVAVQSFRGAQLSEGTWVGYRALGWGEKKDGYDTVEWLAAQPWSTGKIGTLGSSQAGFAQNFLAVTQPPHLVCQYMIDTGLSLFHEGYRIGGTTRPERFLGMDAVCRNPLDNRKLLDEWFAHPTYDAYWQDEDCTRHFDKMNVPCFTVGSWFDFMNVGSVESYIGRQHRGGPNSRGKQQLIIGPWLHGRFKETNRANEMVFPENAKFAMDAHMVRWFDHYLKGIDNGVEREGPVKYYVMGAVGENAAVGNTWRIATDWPISVRETPYYLRSKGELSLLPPGEGVPATVFRADPLHPNTIPERAFPGGKNAQPFEQQREVRMFHSELLSEAVEWTGKVRAELYVTSTAKDTDFIVRVSDVYPNGKSMLLIDYVRRARYRDGYDQEVMMEPNKVYKVAFDVGWLSQVFAKGHRIRVTVASTGAPFYEPNPNTGEPLTIDPPAKTVIAENRLLHEPKHASRILAPWIREAVREGK